MPSSVTAAASLVVGLVLLGAGLSKARAVAVFAGQIADYRLIPESFSGLAAGTIVAAEVLAGGALIVGLVASAPLRQVGAAGATVVLGVFLAALIIAHRHGRNIACACFGGSGELETVGPHSVTRTLLLLLLAVLACFASRPVVSVSTVGFAVIFAALVSLLSEMARLFGPLREATNAIVGQLAERAAFGTTADDSRPSS